MVHLPLGTVSLWAWMRTNSKWSSGPGVKILGVALTIDDGWIVSAARSPIGICPDCGGRSRSWHGWSNRSLQDLPAQGKPVTVRLVLSRWLCANRECARPTFTDRLAALCCSYLIRDLQTRQSPPGPKSVIAGGQSGCLLLRNFRRIAFAINGSPVRIPSHQRIRFY